MYNKKKVAVRKNATNEVDGILGMLGQKIVTYYPELNHILGNQTAALLLRQLMYWHGRGERPDNWVYKTREEFSKELGISVYEYDSARKFLRKYGLIEETTLTNSTFRAVHFRVNLEAIKKVVADYLTDPEWYEPLSKRTDRRKANVVLPRSAENRAKQKVAEPASQKIPLLAWKRSKAALETIQGELGDDPIPYLEDIEDGDEAICQTTKGKSGPIDHSIDYQSENTAKNTNTFFSANAGKKNAYVLESESPHSPQKQRVGKNAGSGAREGITAIREQGEVLGDNPTANLYRLYCQLREEDCDIVAGRSRKLGEIAQLGPMDEEGFISLYMYVHVKWSNLRSLSPASYSPDNKPEIKHMIAYYAEWDSACANERYKCPSWDVEEYLEQMAEYGADIAFMGCLQ